MNLEHIEKSLDKEKQKKIKIIMACNIIRFTGDEIKFKSDKIPTKSIKKNITLNISN